MTKKVTNSLKDSALFLKHALKSPMQVAYFMPSSPWLIDQIAKCAHLHDAKHIMELGPGTGGTTKGILKYMQDDAQLISVEINQKFIDHIEKTIDDKRLSMNNKGAQNLVEIMDEYDWESADVIISGIPFTTLPKGMDKAIMQSIYDALKPGGIFLAYQLRDHVSKLAQPLFGDYTFKKIEFKNIPPMRIYTWMK
ncbi:class I SAM-dependent methyltransferase [Marinicella litoralis]|uniref:Phospholipid N-methyltransferase n=1 Tax=Marinicella litoralis TaxID=644220 RepID=A0A4R6Y424_9GAMM|nr:methyltransferase domain-containing protein [Marinicella litoralis]TDR23888.1 phospholipid N-methyltransferase [Marinicella litoralis]